MSDGSREDVKGDSSNNQKSEHNGAHKGRRQARKALMNFLKASLDVEGSETHILKSFMPNKAYLFNYLYYYLFFST